MNRILIVGAGDIARRLLPWLRQRFRVYVLIREPDSAGVFRQLGACPVIGDLDDHRSLGRLAGLAGYVLHCAPPPGEGRDDPRTRNLLATLSAGQSLPCRVVYISTTGVYGDCRGAAVDETCPPAPQTERAWRRRAAESRLRAFSRDSGVCLSILRAPGIYAPDRLPLERLLRRDPVLHAHEDVFSNHIHADDLARAAGLALFRGRGLRCFNVCDDRPMLIGDFLDAVADAAGLPRPPRAGLASCERVLSPVAMSFMRESRCVLNTRIKCELRWRPHHADVSEGLKDVAGRQSK